MQCRADISGIDSSARPSDGDPGGYEGSRTIHRTSTALIALRTLALLLGLVVPAACQATTRSTMPFIEIAPEDIKGKDTALIYVYRVPDMAGAAGPWAVRLDGQLVALLKQNAYLVLVVRPGRHRVVLGDKPDSYTGSVGKNPLGQGLDMAADGIFARAADQGTFDTVDGGVYFLRMEGVDIDAVSRDDAVQELVRMRYDTGL